MQKKPKIEITFNEKELSKTIQSAQQNYLKTNNIKCPHCGFVSMPLGQKYNCTACGKEIKIIFD